MQNFDECKKFQFLYEFILSPSTEVDHIFEENFSGLRLRVSTILGQVLEQFEKTVSK